MATADTYLTFGAETGQLEAGLAAAQAAVRRTAAEMRALASEMVSTGASADSELGGRLASLGSKLSEAKESVSGFKEELKGAGEGGGGLIASMTEGVSGFLSPLSDAKAGLMEFGETIAAVFVVDKIVEFVRSMGELGEATERSSKILGISTEEVGRLNYIFGITGMSTERLNQMMGRFEEGLAKAASTGTGPMVEGLRALGLSAQELIGLSLPEQFSRIADAVSKFADSPTKTAALQALGRGWVEMIPTLDKGGEAFRKLGEQADATNSELSGPAAEALEEMKQGFYDLGASIRGDATQAFLPLIDAVNAAVKVMRDLSGAISESITQGGAWGKSLWAVVQAVKVLDTAFIALIEMLRTLSSVAVASLTVSKDSAVSAAKAVWDAVHGNFAAAEQDAKDWFNKITEDLKGAGADWVKATKDAIDEMNRLWPSLPTMKGPGAEGGAGAGGPATGDAAALIRRFEGFRSSAYWDVNAYRVGYGSSTTTSPTGAVTPVTAETTTTREDAERDLARRIVEFQSKAAADIGSAWAGLSDKAKASITSVAYNYGHVPAAVVSAAQTGNEAQIASAIAGLSSNVSRRQAEAANITGVSKPEAPAMDESAARKLQDEIDAKTASLAKLRAEGGDAEAIKQIEDELAKLKTRQLEANQAATGGTEAQKTSLAIAEAEAVQQQNALTVAKQKLAAANADAAANRAVGGDKQKQTELDVKAAEAAANVLKVTNQQAEAEAKVDVAKAKQSEDITAIYDAEVKAANVRMTAAGADPVKQAEAQQALIAAQAAYTAAVREQATERGRLEIEKAKEAADQERVVLNEKLKTHQITDAQWLAGTTDALNKEKAVVQQVYDQELAAAKDGSNKKISIALEEQKALGALAKQQAQDQAKAAEDSAKAWKSMADTAASTINSQVDGIISGTTTMKQAFSNMGKSIIEEVAKYTIKWAVEHAFAATSNMAMNNTLVASTLAGNATMAASATASGAAGIAAQAANATQSLAIDAAKVFGGVFGFLAPFLGPFAAGPAAGMEASVLSAGAAFDIGAWSLPQDMIAGVHRGEMIIPSRGGVADEFRTFIKAGGLNPAANATAGASGQAGGRSVSVHPAVNFHVNAVDGQSVAQFFHANSRSIVNAVDRAVRHGQTLGLRAFTP